MKLILDGTPEEIFEFLELMDADEDDEEEELTAEEKEDLERKANEIEFCATVTQAAKKLFDANYK